MRQLPNQETNDYDDLEDVNVCLEDNRDDQIDELVQRSFRKIKKKEQAQASNFLKWLGLLLVSAIVLAGLFQYLVGFSSHRVGQQQNRLVDNTGERKIGSQVEGGQKIESAKISDVKAEAKKEESKVANAADSSQAAKKLATTEVKKEDSVSKGETKKESDQKSNIQTAKSAQNAVNNQDESKKKDQKEAANDSKQDTDKSQQKLKEKQREQETQKQKQKQKQQERRREQEKQKQIENQKQKQKLQEQQRQKQKKQKQQQQQKEEQRKQKEQQQLKQRQTKQKQQQQLKEKQSNQKEQEYRKEKQSNQKEQEQRKEKQRKQKEQEQLKERQRKQKEQQQLKERQRKQKEQQQLKERQRKQKQQEQQKERQRKLKQQEQQKEKQTKQKQQEQQKERQRQKLIEEQEERQKKKQEGFVVPRNLWTVSSRPNYFQVLVGLNHQRFASASGFTKNIVTKQDYSKYLSQEGKNKLQNLFSNLAEKIKNEKSNLQNHIQQIQKKLILLSVLYQNGGIIIDDQMTVTQSFDWIKQIDKNVYANRGNFGVEPKVVGFYSPYYSSSPQKYNKKAYPAMEEVDKYTVLIPTIENYFLAAQKKAEYIGKLIDECITILQAPQQVKKDIAQKRYNYINVDDHDVYYQYFMIASQRILLTKQKELDSSSSDPSVYNFAIDYFGLNLINCYYGPYKTSMFFQKLQSQQRIQIIANQELSQLQSHIGPLRYDLGEFLSKTQKKGGSKKHKVTIMKGSFLQKMYFPNSDESFIIENAQKSVTNQNAEPWKDLPKKIWVFWDTGLTEVDNVPAEVILCVEHLKRIAEASQFTVNQVNSSNVKEYLSDSKISKIEQALDNFKDQKNQKQIRCDLYRLALLLKHGGVYLDTSAVAVQNLNWLLNIARLPSNMIQNRHGQVPEVLLFWDPYVGSSVQSVQWKINEAHNTKSQWLLQYQNSFIAANKDSQFIKEWFELFLQLSEQSTNTIMQTFEKCNVPNAKQFDEGSHSLLSLNTAKCVLGRKQQSLKKSSKKKGKGGVMDYYGVWTMSSYLGPFKFKALNNLDNLDKNGGHYFLTRYSQQYVEGIVGKINFFVKLTGSQRNQLTRFFGQNDKALMEESHSQSVFRKYLYDEKYSRFQTVDDRTVIKLD